MLEGCARRHGANGAISAGLRGHVTLQIAVLGSIYLLNYAVVYTLVGASARRALATRLAAVTMVSRVSGGAMVVIGAVRLIRRMVAR